MNNKRNGFAAALLVAVIAVVLIGAGAWFAWSNNKSKNNAAQAPVSVSENSVDNANAATTTSPTETPTPVQPTPTPANLQQTSPADMKTFNSAAGISFKYPSSWVVSEISDGGHIVISGGPQSRNNLFYISTLGKVFNCGAEGCFANLSQAASQSGLVGMTELTIGGNSAVKGTEPQVTSEVEGKPVIAYIVQVGNNGYSILHDDVNDSVLRAGVNGILASITFSK